MHIKITHTYISDLSVKLQHPDGTEVVLHDRIGGDADNIDTIYGMGGAPVEGLTQLQGKPISGTWKLIIQDFAAQDTGTLDFIKFIVKGYMD